MTWMAKVGLALLLVHLAGASPAVAGSGPRDRELAMILEADGTLRITNREGARPRVRTVAEPDGSLRVVLRGGARVTPRANTGQYDAFFLSASEEHGVPVALIEAVAWAESAFDPEAVSPAGARGLMQLMPATAAELGVTDPFDPAQAIDGGARYLRELLDRFGGRLDLAVAAYNAGPAAVSRYGGVPPYEETQRYVKRVMACYKEALAEVVGLDPSA